MLEKLEKLGKLQDQNQSTKAKRNDTSMPAARNGPPVLTNARNLPPKAAAKKKVTKKDEINLPKFEPPALPVGKGLQPCPCCKRQFNEAAYDRHLPICIKIAEKKAYSGMNTSMKR
jgi:zinc-finger of a C2HC-type